MSETKTAIKTLNGHPLKDAEARERIEQLSAKRGLPRVYIDGEIPTDKNEKLAELRFVDGENAWSAYIKIKCQGRSSLEYPKKNFTVKLYEDANRTSKKKVAFPLFGGQEQNKYVLKANWTDHTHARNVVVARLWSQIIESQPGYAALPQELRNSPNNGAVNGFPVLVYANGVYQGVYTWNIGKDPWMLGMDEDNPNHALISGQRNTAGTNVTETACNFRKLWDGTDSDWELEIGSDRDAVVESFNAVIACIKDEPDSEFKQKIADLLDVQSVIDYDLQMCQDHGGDNSANNLMMATYDLEKWRCVRYDSDGTYGMTGTGEQSMNLAEAEHLGSTYGEQNSLLWSRFEKCFAAEYKTRGAALRKSVLSFENINANFENFVSAIGAEAYADEATAYPTVPVGSKEPRWQFRDWVRKRLEYFDEWLEALPEYVLCTGVSLSQQTLSFASASSQTLTATLAPSDCNDTVLWASSNPNVAYVTGGVVTAVSDGEATITVSCGGQTATCSVTVDGVGSAEDALTYSLASETTVSSLDSILAINADNVPTTEAGSFTILLDFTPTMNESQNNTIAHQRSSWYNGGGPEGYFLLKTNTYYHDYLLETFTTGGEHPGEYLNTRFNMDADSDKRVALAIRYDQGDAYHVKVDASDGTTPVTNTGDVQFPRLLGVGKSNFMVGGNIGGWSSSENQFGASTEYTAMTIHRFKIYSRYLSDAEITEFFDGMESE